MTSLVSRLCTLMLASLLLAPMAAQAGDKAEPSMDSLLAKLEASSWVAEGAREPKRIAYVFTDMACPYCARLWENMQPMIEDEDNVLQVRHIIVGLINPKRSFTQGGAVLAAPDPAAALAEHEAHYDDGGIRPLQRVPDAIRSQIQSNTGLMIGLGLQGTPALIFQDSQGRWRVAPGVIGEADLRQEVFQLDKG